MSFSRRLIIDIPACWYNFLGFYLVNVDKLIAVIDDEPDFLITITSILKRKGFRVITGSTESAIKSILERNPDLILLDINLPGKSGLEICRQVKSGKSTKDIPIVIVSGNADIRFVYAGCHADNFLQKPFGVPQLINVISKLIEGSPDSRNVN
jgi:DNA-binding response OmpR family regulator